MTRTDQLPVQTRLHTNSSEYDRIVEQLAGWRMDSKKKGSSSTGKWALTESLKE